MVGPILQPNDLDSFRLGTSLIKDSYTKSAFGKSFDEVLETQVKEASQKVKEKASDVAEDNSDSKKKKTSKNLNDGLPNITQIIQNADRKNSLETQKTYLLLDKFKQNKKSQEEDDDLPRGGLRQQTLNNANNIAGQPLFQPVYDQNQRRMTKSQMLEKWEKLAPTVSEDITKKSVRIDIPLLNDVQALVLRLNPDKSITASLLGSKAMGKLIKENKDKLDRNLRHHQLSLKEFNTYSSQLTFNTESGTKKQKRKAKQATKAANLDLI
ncbi:MAG: hypothetical protein HY094_09100 [Candidatus Melainabacteria bacterium]|nr:hypothetical protein [Candidatus Melainabacteria bacterium]